LRTIPLQDTCPCRLLALACIYGFPITNHNVNAKVIIPLIVINAIFEDK
jgi:hypothetical protein